MVRMPALVRAAVVTFTLSLMLLATSEIHASIDIASDIGGYYNGCVAKFKAAKKTDLMDQLARSSHKFRIARGDATDTQPDDADLASTRGVGSGGTTRIDPNDRSKFPGEYPPNNHEPCATLYHEMAHLVSYDNGTLDRRLCDGAHKTTLEEVQATWAENRYRATQPELKDFQRTSYGEYFPLPLDGHMCKPAPPPPRRSSGGCSVSAVGAPSCSVINGDPHLTTFDQLHYDFQAVGEFVAVRSTRRPDLEIQVRQTPMDNSKDASVATAVTMLVNGDIVGLYIKRGEPKLYINGKGFPFSQLPISLAGGGAIWRLETDELSVIWPDGSEALLYRIGPYGFRLGVNLATSRRGGVEGLLGNFDGSDTNDLKLRGSSAVLREATFEALYPRFSDSWRVTAATSLFQYDNGQSTDSFTNRRLPTRPIDASKMSNRALAELACSGIKDDRLRKECVMDVGVSGDAVFAKSAKNTETVFLSKVRAGSAHTAETGGNAQGLVFSGRVSGQLSSAVADCTTMLGAGQFALTLSGLVNGNKAELYVNVTQTFHGAGTYAIGSIGSSVGQASLAYDGESYATEGDHPGTFRVDAGNRSGSLAATLGGVEVNGRWVCGKVSNL